MTLSADLSILLSLKWPLSIYSKDVPRVQFRFSETWFNMTPPPSHNTFHPIVLACVQGSHFWGDGLIDCNYTYRNDWSRSEEMTKITIFPICLKVFWYSTHLQSRFSRWKIEGAKSEAYLTSVDEWLRNSWDVLILFTMMHSIRVK